MFLALQGIKRSPKKRGFRANKAKMLYVETISEPALSLVEDIVYLKEARKLVECVGFIDNKTKYSVLQVLADVQRKAESILLHGYLEPSGRPIENKLKEGIAYEQNQSQPAQEDA